MERRQFVLAVPLLFAAGRLAAHHGWSTFDETRPLYLAGKAQKVSWQNPHAELMLELASPLVLPPDLAKRNVPRQSASVDAVGILAKAALPTRRDAVWEIELSPLTRLEAWKVQEIKPGEPLELVGYTFPGEKGEPIFRVEYLFRGGTATPLRSSPA